jgi:hypothetical protein
MVVETRAHVIVPKGMEREGSSFVWLFSMLFFIIPFGKLQNAVLEGMTLPKLLIPVCFFVQLVWMIGRYRLHRHLLIYLLFIFSTTPSFITGSDDYLLLVLSLLGYVALFQLLRNTSFRTVADLKCVIKPYIFGLAVVCCLVVAAFFGYDVGSAFGRALVDSWYGMPIVLGSEENPNGFATFFIPGLTGVAALFVLSQTRALKSVFIFLYLFFCVLLALTVSRSAAIGALLGTLTIFLIASYRSSEVPASAKPRRKVKFAMIVGIFIGVVVLLGVVFSQVSESLDLTVSDKFIADKDESSTYRWRIIEKATEDYDVLRFVLGTGYGKFKPFPGEVENAHNIFLGVLVEFGFIAFLSFASLITLALGSYLRALKRALGKRSRIIVGFHVGSLVGLLFHGMFHEIYVNLSFWYFLAAAHPIYLITRPAKQPPFGDRGDALIFGRQSGPKTIEGNTR